jgi:predicted N-acetyltransferase YhbS
VIDDDTLYVAFVAREPSLQERGVGESLMRAAIAEARR